MFNQKAFKTLQELLFPWEYYMFPLNLSDYCFFKFNREARSL